jgi:hypothetical protein
MFRREKVEECLVTGETWSVNGRKTRSPRHEVVLPWRVISEFLLKMVSTLSKR